MAEKHILVSLCGTLAPMAASVVFLAPWPTIKKVLHDKHVGTLPILPYTCMIANCVLWTAYGLLKQQVKIWGTNVLGLFCGIYFFVKFSKYAPPKSSTLPGSIRQHVNVCFAVVAAIWGLIYLFPSSSSSHYYHAETMIGNLAVLFCVAMFASPLAALKTVLQTKSAKSIPLPFTLATVLNCFLWSVVGLFDMHDVNVYFPNLLGLGFGMAQVFLRLLYGDGNDVKVNPELELIM